MSSETHKDPGLIERLTCQITAWVGSVWALAVAFLVIVVWATTGPYFAYDNTWQLVINTSTTIVTFLMVFIIQRAQNKDTAALHLKLNELIHAVKGARNSLINVEDLSEAEVRALHEGYSAMTKQIEQKLETKRQKASRFKEAAAS